METFLTGAQEKFPNSLDVLKYLADLRLDQGRVDEALELRTQQLLNGESDRASLQSFRELLEPKPVEDVIRRQELILARNPRRQFPVDAFFRLHLEAGRTNRYEDADALMQALDGDDS